MALLPAVALFPRTRIPVWLLERYRRLGVTERDLLDSYPTLRNRANRAERTERANRASERTERDSEPSGTTELDRLL